MARFGSRKNPVARPRADGTFDLVLDESHREAIGALLGELDDLVAEGPGDPSLRRLAPPAYLEDPDKDAEYQLLAGDELRTSRHEAIAAVRGSLAKEQLTEGELWAWLQALNALRLVVGTRLGIEDDARHAPDGDPDSPEALLWNVYDFATWLQHCVLRALGG